MKQEEPEAWRTEGGNKRKKRPPALRPSRRLLPLLRQNQHPSLSLLQCDGRGWSTLKHSPLAKKIARDNKVDLSHVQGTGPGGRVVRKDVEAAFSSGQRHQRSAVRNPRLLLFLLLHLFRVKMRLYN